MESLGDIGQFHKLSNIWVRPDQLILDPRNPRINVEVNADQEYSVEELLSDEVQKEILTKINMEEYRVAELIRGIARTGFLEGAGPMIVEHIKGTNKYVVLEGNRRATAIKHLLANPGSLPQSARRTIEEIEVKEFTYRTNPKYSKDEVVDILLGTIHISGPVSWGAMEKAYYIYKTYKRELKKISGRDEFFIDTKVIDKLCAIFNSKDSEIRKNLRVYRVFEQLKYNAYQVDAKKYSLIELATGNRHLRKAYFGMDAAYHFSNEGLARFSSLCLEADSPISNPRLFNQFTYIQRHGDEHNVREVETRLKEVEDVYVKVRDEKRENRVFEELRDILSRLRKLNLSGFVRDNDERDVVQRIAYVVNKKLIPIVADEGGEYCLNLDEWEYPETIYELMELEASKLQEIVKETLRNRPNNTCVLDRLPAFVLRFLSLHTKGNPRKLAVNRLEKEINEMIGAGLLSEYHGGANLRVKLLIE